MVQHLIAVLLIRKRGGGRKREQNKDRKGRNKETKKEKETSRPTNQPTTASG